ncbi:MAG: NTP transferase domain-containing protein [Candidatus Paceibacterota bacterium]
MDITFQNVQIIILAAGKSKRMGGEEPKALAKLQGKPFLRHILDTLGTLPLPLSPTIVVGHKRHEVMDAIGPDFFYAIQEEQLGTGHAVASALPHLEQGHETVLVLSTDQPLISAETIKNIINSHKETGAIITLGTVTVPDFTGWHKAFEHFGRIIRTENGDIEKIVEFKDATEEQKSITEVNPALYAFDAAWLSEHVRALKNENAQQEYYLTDLVHIACQTGNKVNAVSLASILEAMQPNTREELATLEGLIG